MLDHPRVMHVDAAIAPDLSHPVVDVLRQRAAGGSAPGARRDPHRVALVLEGGGMRGVVSAGMAAALERLGLTQSFDLVVGSSAGAINGGALVAGVARGCAAAYYGPFASRSFVNPARVLWGRPVMSVDYALGYDAPDLDAERHQRAVESPIDLHCVAVDVATAAAVDLSGMATKQELWDAILASSRMPWAGGPPVTFRGRRFVDGGLAAPIPVAEALAAGATQEPLAPGRPPHRAPPAPAQPRARHAVPRPGGGVRDDGHRHRAALGRRGRRAAARARPAPAGRDARGGPARAPLRDPGPGRGRCRAARRAGALVSAAIVARGKPRRRRDGG
jgi:predicted acylesterase/phospholipase RssA